MCLSVYIGLDNKISFEKSNNDFLKFENLTENETPIKNKFSKKNVYYLGSDTGCSCELTIEDTFNPIKDKSPQEFLKFLEKITKIEDVELYSCWDGDWNDEIIENIRLEMKDINLFDKYPIQEKIFFIVCNQQ